MRNKRKLISWILGIALASSAAPVLAVPIVGGISFSDGFQTTGTTTSVVSGLVNIDVINAANVAQVNGCSGAFGACLPPPVLFGLASDFTIGAAPVLAFSYNGFDFTINSFGVSTPTPLSCNAQGVCTDALEFVAQGTVDDGAGPGDPSQFQLVWTANGSCLGSLPGGCTSNVSASWSASISATGSPVRTPEPASLALFGVGLLACAAIRKLPFNRR